MGWEQKNGKQRTISWSAGGLTGSNFKTSGTLIPSTDATNNKPVNNPTRGADNREFSLNEVGIGLESDPVCSKAMTSIIPTDVRMIDEGSDCTSQDNGKKNWEKNALTGI